LLQDKKEQNDQEQLQGFGIPGRQQNRGRKKAQQCDGGESQLVAEFLANQLEKSDDSQQSRDIRYQQQCIRRRQAADRREAAREHRIQRVKHDVLLNGRIAVIPISLGCDLEIPF
jgi:hypothetical protein